MGLILLVYVHGRLELEARDLLLEAREDVLARRVLDLRDVRPEPVDDLPDLGVVREVHDLLDDVVREGVDDEELQGRRGRVVRADVVDDRVDDLGPRLLGPEVEAILDDVRRELVAAEVQQLGLRLVAVVLPGKCPARATRRSPQKKSIVHRKDV